MFHVVCASTASHLLTKAELQAMLEKTCETNAKVGITGMLLYKDGSFLQVLEGDQEAVMKLASRIKEHHGHKNFQMLLRGTSEHRLFPDWSVGFRNLTDNSLKCTPGFSDFLNTPFTGVEFSANPAGCMKLLLSFKKNM
jgi:Sensors of blue-light using FAD